MADWVHTFKGAVLASEYDFASHMNSRMYVSRFDQATWFLLHAIGVTPASMKQKNLRVAIVRQNYQFLEELRGGELVEIKSGFLTVGQKYFRFLHQMYNDETGNMVATYVNTGPDHFAHSLVYADIALTLAPLTTGGEDIGRVT